MQSISGTSHALCVLLLYNLFSAHGDHTVFVHVMKLQLHVKSVFPRDPRTSAERYGEEDSAAFATFDPPVCLFLHPRWPTDYEK
ncbi:hypothetical protein AMELA_G00085320 [Ameiurus melas]|uniref:Secreted protein n=1 Tax=Ameiurus melas TaxID=219545 RepID=A0A7J6AVE9_AMEME|nr:hypothetical protein AMELA_G00085320 [Ameiurus melas]